MFMALLKMGVSLFHSPIIAHFSNAVRIWSALRKIMLYLVLAPKSWQRIAKEF